MKRTQTSVAETLALAHAELVEDLRKLEEAVRPGSGKKLVQLLARLGATRRHIAAHFRFQEQNGYLDTVRKREPRLERTVQHLAEEHRQLAQSLDVLVGEAGVATSLADAYREKVQAWIERVLDHEARENDLVQAAFDLDLGGED